MDHFEASGRWWLPGQESDSVTGTLRFDGEGWPTLHVVGSLRTSRVFFVQPHEFSIILGLAGGKAITLFRCSEAELVMSGRGEPTSIYHAQVAFVGAHFESVDSLRFGTVMIAYSGLDRWARRSGLNLSQSVSGTRWVEIRYEQPEAIEYVLEDGFRVSIVSEFATAGDFISSAGFKQRTLFAVKAPTPRAIDEYLEGICAYLQGLVTLGAGQSQSITYLRAHVPADKPEEPAGSLWVDILFGQQPIGGTSSATHREALFHLADFGERFSISLNRWISRGTLLRPVYNLYFGTLANPAMYVEHQFLNMMQAVESYHRLAFGGEYLDAVAFEDVRRTLTRAIPVTGNEAFEHALRERLKYHNEWSLRKRLRGLLDQYASLASAVLPGPDTFLSDVVNTRNYLTHYDPDLKALARIERVELYNLAQRLKVLLEVCLLHELGLADEPIREIILRSQAYQYILWMVDRSRK